MTFPDGKKPTTNNNICTDFYGFDLIANELYTCTA